MRDRWRVTTIRVDLNEECVGQIKESLNLTFFFTAPFPRLGNVLDVRS